MMYNHSTTSTRQPYRSDTPPVTPTKRSTSRVEVGISVTSPTPVSTAPGGTSQARHSASPSDLRRGRIKGKEKEKDDDEYGHGYGYEYGIGNGYEEKDEFPVSPTRLIHSRPKRRLSGHSHTHARSYSHSISMPPDQPGSPSHSHTPNSAYFTSSSSSSSIPFPLSRQQGSSSSPSSNLNLRGWRCSFGIPRFFKTPRRLAAYTALLISLLLLLRLIGEQSLTPGLGLDSSMEFGGLKFPRWLNIEALEEEEPECVFLSPMAAYRRDLRRLRIMYPAVMNHSSSAASEAYGEQRDDDHDRYDHERHHGDIEHNDYDPNAPHQGQRKRDTIPPTAHASPAHTHNHHLFSSTGHLLLSSSPSARHPIPALLALGEKRWEDLLSRQSLTLAEAVQEYTRRYGRRPPKGFDVWWQFAMDHNLVLPDEYDRINLDLAPFFALPRKEMKRRMGMVEGMPETFTLVVKDGSVKIVIKDQGGLKWDGTLPRAKDAAGLLKSFAKHLPDLRATFSIFDQPQIYLSWARRGSLIDLGLRGEVTTHTQETEGATVRLSRSCAPDSNYRKNSTFYEGRSFIYDELEAGDICQNPYLIPIHGLTIESHDQDSHPRPHTQLLPLFSLAKTSINSDILITPLDQFYDDVGPDPAWHRKSSEKLAWRGSPTGISMMTSDLPWENSHRMRLHFFANNGSNSDLTFISPDMASLHNRPKQKPHHTFSNQSHDASSPSPSPGFGSGSGPASRSIVGPGDTTRLLAKRGHAQVPMQATQDDVGYKEDQSTILEATDFFLDISLAGDPLQCSEEDGTCQEMKELIDWAPHQSRADLNEHKFLLDIDGNGWSGRFRRLMSTNSVVIKTGIFTEWFQPHLIPWFMYIPAKLDFSDLFDILAFLRGTPNEPDGGFEETAMALARNGQCFVKKMFRMEDLQAYMMRLFLEYARLAADEGVDMDFYYGADEELDDSSPNPDSEQYDIHYDEATATSAASPPPPFSSAPQSYDSESAVYRDDNVDVKNNPKPDDEPEAMLRDTDVGDIPPLEVQDPALDAVHDPGWDEKDETLQGVDGEGRSGLTVQPTEGLARLELGQGVAIERDQHD